MTNVRGASLAAIAALFATLGGVGNVASEEIWPRIVTLGDSYINSYGVAPADTFAARLESGLNANGHRVTIVEPGWRNTSKAGLIWLTKSKDGIDLLANSANHVVIVELGSNDCGNFDLDHSRANLDQLLSILGDKGIPVLVAGTTAEDYCGRDYAEPFSRMFSELAAKHSDLLYADFKEGVTGHPELLQNDGIHPTAAGNEIIARNMLPVVEALLAQLQPH
jgi:acyl-CoA thioesterase-1